VDPELRFGNVLMFWSTFCLGISLGKMEDAEKVKDNGE
jgi:hypothetical protein